MVMKPGKYQRAITLSGGVTIVLVGGEGMYPEPPVSCYIDGQRIVLTHQHGDQHGGRYYTGGEFPVRRGGGGTAGWHLCLCE
jgi:hypothetical protein